MCDRPGQVVQFGRSETQAVKNAIRGMDTQEQAI